MLSSAIYACTIREEDVLDCIERFQEKEGHVVIVCGEKSHTLIIEEIPERHTLIGAYVVSVLQKFKGRTFTHFFVGNIDPAFPGQYHIKPVMYMWSLSAAKNRRICVMPVKMRSGTHTCIMKI